MDEKYRFLVFSNTKLCSKDILVYTTESIVKKVNYGYIFFCKNKEQYSKLCIELDDCEVVNFSQIGRYLNKQKILEIYNSNNDKVLKEQLYEIIKASQIVNRLIEHLDIKPVELARIFSSRSADISMWQNMVAKPDNFKIEIMEYLLSLGRDYADNHFVNYLFSKARGSFRVRVINTVTNKEIKIHTRAFKNEVKALDYFSSLKSSGDYDNLDLELQMLNNLNSVVRSYKFKT